MVDPSLTTNFTPNPWKHMLLNATQYWTQQVTADTPLRRFPRHPTHFPTTPTMQRRATSTGMQSKGKDPSLQANIGCCYLTAALRWFATRSRGTLVTSPRSRTKGVELLQRGVISRTRWTEGGERCSGRRRDVACIEGGDMRRKLRTMRTRR